MKQLIAVATASAFVLGIAGGAYAAGSTSSSTMPSGTTAQYQTGTTQTAPINLSGDQIRQAQQQLKSAGVYQGAVDGQMSQETKQAIQQFQQRHGLSATGNLDQQTMAALQNNARGTGSGSGGGMGTGTAPSGGQR